MSEHRSTVARVISVIAATIIALACGTNYAYSAWGPQFAERMKLSSTQSNLIGTSGNLGMYIGGIPVGMLVDRRGPRPGVLVGGGLLMVGYFSMHRAYEGGPGSIALPWLCFFAFMTGIGGASAFSGSIKTSALNWPDHRGTATAFPLSAFGLGAFFFTAISSFAFPDNTSTFLLVLSIGCLGMCYLSVAFLRVVPSAQAYTSVSANEERRSSNPLRVTRSKEGRHSADHPGQEPGTQTRDPHASTALLHKSGGTSEDAETLEASGVDPDETSSLISSSPGDVPYEGSTKTATHHGSPHIDVRGFALLKHTEFYQLWLLLGILTGIGLMTIK
ncbi:MAG: hypothetical protein L6R39_006159 [Caloplaca ligustica]|nr:MAG: hypothetical protein L6R39_006159 [Caloplaca ligustica]